MNREVDLVSYLPPFLAEYKETNMALTAQNPELAFIWKAADRILCNEFIVSADEYGISRFEKILKICPSLGETLEDRRARIQNRWFNVPPYTVRILAARLSKVLGGDHNFSIWQSFERAYELVLTIYSMDDHQLEEIKYLLATILPVNIVVYIIYESVHQGEIYCGAAIKEADIIEIRQR